MTHRTTVAPATDPQPVRTAARLDLLELADLLEDLVADAPPLTAEQREKLRALLRD